MPRSPLLPIILLLTVAVLLFGLAGSRAQNAQPQSAQVPAAARLQPKALPRTQASQQPELRPVNPNPQSAPGAPPIWEQVGQGEQVANADAAAAARAEIGSPEGTLGVGGAMPSYAKSQTTQTSHSTSTTPAKKPAPAQ